MKLRKGAEWPKDHPVKILVQDSDPDRHICTVVVLSP